MCRCQQNNKFFRYSNNKKVFPHHWTRGNIPVFAACYMEDNPDCKSAESVVTALRVVIDAAERGVKLIQDYNLILTNDEEKKQFLRQVVQDHCRLYPETSKKTILAGIT